MKSKNNKDVARKRIYLSSPHMSKEEFEKQYVQEAFETNWIAPLGTNVNEFERELAQKVNINSAAALSSGTAAIHLALKAVGVEKGDIVLCPTLTFSATANPIIYQGAIPVFVDSDISTWNISPFHLEMALKKYNNVKAVIIVHLYGLSADMDPILEICNKYGVAVIEDAAESLGSYYKGKSTGTFGDFGIYSFNGNKIITTSGGGMLVSNNSKMIEKSKFWATQSRDVALYYQHSELGYNYRMSNVVAGIGRGQLKILDERVKRKKEIFNYYRNELSEIEELTFMPVNNWDEPNYWLSCATVQGNIKPINIIEALESENIESRYVWKPMHLQPYFETYDYVGENVAETLFENGICLPSDTKMTDEDLERVVNIIKQLFSK